MRTLRISIDELVLSGLPPAHDASALARALEASLADLAREVELPNGWSEADVLRSQRASLTIQPGANAREIGEGIARSLLAGLTTSHAPSAPPERAGGKE